MPWALVFLFLLIAVPLAEIGVLIRLGEGIGLWPTLLAIVLTAVVGIWLLRRQGFATLSRAQASLEAGRLPLAEIFDAVCLLLAGAFLLTPGFITDSLGGLLLLPPFRTLLRFALGALLARRLAPGAPEGGVVDGEFRVLTEEPEENLPPDPKTGSRH
jgi:UPF0716 protein FxsA